jgi:hypothetical protein
MGGQNAPLALFQAFPLIRLLSAVIVTFAKIWHSAVPESGAWQAACFGCRWADLHG